MRVLRRDGSLSAGWDLDAQYERIARVIDEAMDSEKSVWMTCPKCSKRSEVLVPDTTARIRAVELALDQGYGKAPTSAATGVAVPSSGQLSSGTVRLEDLTDEQLEEIIRQGGGDPDLHDVSDVDWAERAREPRRPDPLLVRGAG